MTPSNCEYVRDVLPELVAGTLSSVDEAALRSHLQSCADCQAELELVTAVSRARLTVPDGLHARVVSASRNRRTPAWSGRMTVAASIAIAVIGGSVLLMQRDAVPDVAVPKAVQSEPPAESGAGWLSVEDAFVSGTASLRDLSEDELKTLLSELGT
jgi:predicted anti-sigma-YlaC factor YlaD